MLHFAPWKVVLIVGTVVLGFLFALPNFFSSATVANWPGFVPNKQVVLGLDLQGGSHLLLEIDRQGVIDARLDTITSDVRRYLRDARIPYTGIGVQNGTVQVRITDPTRVQAAIDALAPLTQSTGIGIFGGAAPAEVTISTEADGLLRLQISNAALEQRVQSARTQSIEVIRRRIDELGTVEPNIQAQGADRIVVQVPGLDDPQRLKELLQQTAQLTFHMVDQLVTEQALAQTRPTPDQLLLPTTEQIGISYLVERLPLVSGEDLENAQAGFDSRTNEPTVNFRFNLRGAQAFGQATAQNVGRQFAIVLDDQIISAPNIREPIPGGTGQISGGFTVEQANDLAILLRAGALPADLTIIEQRTVGASLGQDSIRAGIVASIVAVIGIALFMLVFYGILGFFADIALVVGNIFIVGILSFLGATLTLPGIAGIVLTMGMAVDANVLIYERMREEAHEGRSTISALDNGFRKAFGTIIDSHLTALIAAMALFLLGSGPIRGFAVTLAIGIISTLFTAYLVTRLIVSVWVQRFRPKAVPL